MEQQYKIEIEELCLKKKALDSKFIDPASIVIGYWTRYKCHGDYFKILISTHSPDFLLFMTELQE